MQVTVQQYYDTKRSNITDPGTSSSNCKQRQDCIIFSTLAQYELQIENARVRWFHRNENGSTVFSVITDAPVLSNEKWYHVAAMYDGLRGISQIYINGQLSKQETADPGVFLSRDWSKFAGTLGFDLLNTRDVFCFMHSSE